MMVAQKVQYKGVPVTFGTSAKKTPKVVIVGNGVGGVAAGRELNRLLSGKKDLAEVTLVGPTDQYFFKPQLHELLNGKNASTPIRSLFPEKSPVQFKQAAVTKITIDPANKVLETTQGPLPFDYLILAVGSKTAYFNHEKNAKLYAIPLEETGNISRVKTSVKQKLDAAAKAAKGSADQAQALSFVVVGGGATGVEMAFELKHYVQSKINQDYPTLKGIAPKVTIVEAMPDILNGFGDKEKTYIKKRLAQQGIQVLTNHWVDTLDETGLKLSDKTVKDAPVAKELKTKDPMWVTGVRAHPLVEMLPTERLPGNQRVKVTPHLELPNRSDVYVIGDSSAAMDPASNRPLPPLGQVAEQQGAYVARDVFAKLTAAASKDPKQAENKDRPGFTFKSRGTMFSLGPGDGIVHLYNKYFISGWMADKIRQAAYCLKSWNP